MQQFYHGGKTAAVLGDQAFINWVRESQLPEVEDKVIVEQVLPGKLSIDHIVRLVAAYHHMDATRLTKVVKGTKIGLLARKMAMYVSAARGLSLGSNHAHVWPNQ